MKFHMVYRLQFFHHWNWCIHTGSRVSCWRSYLTSWLRWWLFCLPSVITTVLIIIKSLLLMDFHALWEPSLTVLQPALHHLGVSLWKWLVAELRFVACFEQNCSNAITCSEVYQSVIGWHYCWCWYRAPFHLKHTSHSCCQSIKIIHKESQALLSSCMSNIMHLIKEDLVVCLKWRSLLNGS